MIDYGAWHFVVWDKWEQKVYGETLSENHLFDDGRIHHQDKFFRIIDGRAVEWEPFNENDTYYIKMVKGNTFYLLPQRYVEKLPIIPTKTLPIHLKKCDSDVWRIIIDCDSMVIPKVKTMEFREFLESWNPISHNNPKTHTFLKFVAFSQGIKLGLCGQPGSGKNTNLTIRRYITKSVAHKVKSPTRAKFYSTLYFNDYVNVDEITSWNKTDVNMVEDIAAELGDESPDMDKYAKDKNRNLELMKNLNFKTLTFTFNPPSDRNPYTFHSRFRNSDKILDRFPLLWVDGKVTQSPNRPTDARAVDIMNQNFHGMCKVASNVEYWKYHINGHLHKFNQDKNPFKINNRFKNNTTALLDVIDCYCCSQTEFDEWMTFIQEMMNLYIKKGLEVHSEESVQFDVYEEKVEG